MIPSMRNGLSPIGGSPQGDVPAPQVKKPKPDVALNALSQKVQEQLSRQESLQTAFRQFVATANYPSDILINNPLFNGCQMQLAGKQEYAPVVNLDVNEVQGAAIRLAKSLDEGMQFFEASRYLQVLNPFALESGGDPLDTAESRKNLDFTTFNFDLVWFGLLGIKTAKSFANGVGEIQSLVNRMILLKNAREQLHGVIQKQEQIQASAQAFNQEESQKLEASKKQLEKTIQALQSSISQHQKSLGPDFIFNVPHFIKDLLTLIEMVKPQFVSKTLPLLSFFCLGLDIYKSHQGKKIATERLEKFLVEKEKMENAACLSVGKAPREPCGQGEDLPACYPVRPHSWNRVEKSPIDPRQLGVEPRLLDVDSDATAKVKALQQKRDAASAKLLGRKQEELRGILEEANRILDKTQNFEMVVKFLKNHGIDLLHIYKGKHDLLPSTKEIKPIIADYINVLLPDILDPRRHDFLEKMRQLKAGGISNADKEELMNQHPTLVALVKQGHISLDLIEFLLPKKIDENISPKQSPKHYDREASLKQLKIFMNHPEMRENLTYQLVRHEEAKRVSIKKGLTTLVSRKFEQETPFIKFARDSISAVFIGNCTATLAFGLAVIFLGFTNPLTLIPSTALLLLSIGLMVVGNQYYKKHKPNLNRTYWDVFGKIRLAYRRSKLNKLDAQILEKKGKLHQQAAEYLQKELDYSRMVKPDVRLPALDNAICQNQQFKKKLDEEVQRFQEMMKERNKYFHQSIASLERKEARARWKDFTQRTVGNDNSTVNYPRNIHGKHVGIDKVLARSLLRTMTNEADQDYQEMRLILKQMGIKLENLLPSGAGQRKASVQEIAATLKQFFTLDEKQLMNLVSLNANQSSQSLSASRSRQSA